MFLARSLENHIFRSMSPKITNNISLESLGRVESTSAQKLHSFGTKFETIFKLSQTPLLV
jgi:hypothetical protein